ncbi:hypothetical protein CRUP_021901 [Coryphaenoides rupestris]|nr:hypothetical protein CRUP_021901 [Coryphaenoides rupestris]
MPDTVYLHNQVEREEYVLSDYGIIYIGTAYTYRGRPWFYNQFDEGVLHACIHILDNCKTPINERGNAITVCRQVSAKINSQDMDNGVLMGNWGESFPNGTSPLMWTGSRKILQIPFLSVPFLRCMGIPARVVSNFNSAHDNDGNLKTDLYYTEDHMKHPLTTDSIWNFHCWNEVFLSRPDLPFGYGGWQCVDATPQETSDGFYRCGPASVNAVKEGMVCYGFDTPFVYAEVNSNVVYSTINKYNEKQVFKVDTTLVGLCLITKGLGKNNTTGVDITMNYKNVEGSPADIASLEMAKSMGLVAYDQYGTSASNLTLSIFTKPNIIMGEDVNLTLQFSNNTDKDIEFNGTLDGFLVYYTGVDYKQFLNKLEVHTIPATTVFDLDVTVSKETYQNMGYHNILMFQLIGSQEMRDSQI